ncbi:TrmH family RNA methyltransferase [Roseimaritima ulvae]|nr:RNA methyltransferase [Roseimaritima ulvae]
MQWIEDLSDPRLDVFRKLRAAATRPAGEFFVAEGRNVVERLLASDFEVVSLLCSVACEDWLAEQPLAAETELLRVNNQQIRELVGFDFHRGVLACARRRPRDAAQRLPTLASRQIMLALCEVTDAENVGSIVRTATALGVTDILLSKGCADPFSRRALRVSMGTVLQQKFWNSPDMAASLSTLRDTQACRIVATTLGQDAVELAAFPRNDQPVVLLLGNEGQGLAAGIESLATDRVTIPMHQDTDSLNVGVAAGIVLYQLSR